MSRFLPQDGVGRYFGFSTAVGEKMLTTAIGLGNEQHGFSKIGQRALAVALAHAGESQPIIVVPIAAASAKTRAQKHVERCLRAAPHGSVLFILCEDSKTHDLASRPTRPTWKSGQHAAVGTILEVRPTVVPCGLRALNTWVTVPSLPPASSACSTTSTECFR